MITLPESANFDNVAAVDGADFHTWQRGYGLTDVSASHVNGDANGDEFIDDADLAVWEAQFGGTSTLAGATVPEPSSWLLAMFASLFCCSRRRPI